MPETTGGYTSEQLAADARGEIEAVGGAVEVDASGFARAHGAGSMRQGVDGSGDLTLNAKKAVQGRVPRGRRSAAAGTM